MWHDDRRTKMAGNVTSIHEDQDPGGGDLFGDSSNDNKTSAGEEPRGPTFYLYQGDQVVSTKIIGPINVMVDVSIHQIPSHAFAQQDSLLSIALPRDLHHIGDRAFSQCHSLIGVALPSRLEILGRSAFCRMYFFGTRY